MYLLLFCITVTKWTTYGFSCPDSLQPAANFYGFVNVKKAGSTTCMKAGDSVHQLTFLPLPY